MLYVAYTTHICIMYQSNSLIPPLTALIQVFASFSSVTDEHNRDSTLFTVHTYTDRFLSFITKQKTGEP